MLVPVLATATTSVTALEMYGSARDSSPSPRPTERSRASAGDRPAPLAPEAARRELLRRGPAAWAALTDAVVASGAIPEPALARYAARILLFRVVLLLVRGGGPSLPPGWVDRVRAARRDPDATDTWLWGAFVRAVGRLAPPPERREDGEDGLFDHSDPAVAAVALDDHRLGVALAPLVGADPSDPLPDALARLTADVLGDLHEALAGARVDRRRARGAYYTPPAVVNDMVTRALDGLRPLADPTAWGAVRVLDPAVGSGRFLCEAARQLAARRGDARSADVRAAAATQLVGVDADPFALRLTRVLLADTVAGPREPLRCPGSDLLHGDALLLLAGAALDGAGPTAGRAGLLAQPFDVVIGNPPYGVVPSARARAALRDRFPHHRGAFDRYRLFLEAALAALAPGGRAALLLPTTWMTLAHAAPLRDHILAHHNLREVTRIARDAFPGVNVDVAVTIIERSPPDDRPVLLRHTASLAALAEGDVAVEEAAARSVLGARRALLGPTRRNGRRAAAVLERLTATLPPARAQARFVCGLKPYQRGKGRPPQSGAEGRSRVFEVDGPVDETCRPLVVGGHVQPYALAWEPDRWLRYGPWLAEPRDSAIFDAPLKLVGRQTGDRIVAAPDTDRRVARDSTWLALAPDGATPAAARRTLLWLLAVLNDPIATWLFRQGDPDEVDKRFPQVRVSSLGRLPLPPIGRLPAQDAAEAVRLVEERIAIGRAALDGAVARGHRRSPPAGDRLAACAAPVEERLAALVAAAFGLSADEAAEIRAAVA